MSEFIYRGYGLIHYLAKKVLGRSVLSGVPSICPSKIKKGVDENGARDLWLKFIDKSIIEQGSSFSNFHYAGYLEEEKQWCLPSWIWTNAAIVRMFCAIGEIEKAKVLAERLASVQEKCGGWVVRNDYDGRGAIPMLAPNDSAYIANNTFLSLYKVTGEQRYLEIAKHCADWIIDTARKDGMVYTGYNMRDGIWDKRNIIVDVGFTAGLFANLVEMTAEERYKDFSTHFVDSYIRLFYVPNKRAFATSINSNGHQQGGLFGRGQAWALEGLIPAYRVLRDDGIRMVIDACIENLTCRQLSNGAWAYNLSNKMLGEDCKAVSVIACILMEWYKECRDERLKRCVLRALQWCYKHTAVEGETAGGIFSYSMEGGIVKNLYCSCAFVYSSAYAIELQKQICNG